MAKGNPKFYKAKRGSTWYAYYYDPYGKYKGESLKTKNEREANERIKELEAKWWEENAKKIQSDALKKHGIDMKQLAEEIVHDMGIRAKSKAIKGQLKCYMPGSASFRLLETYTPPNIIWPGQESAASGSQQKDEPPKTKLDEFWDKFLPWAEQNKKRHTVRNYRSFWGTIKKVLRPKCVEDITPVSIVALIEHWRKNKVTDRSIDAKLNGIQGIFSNGIERKFYSGENPVPEARKLVRLKPKPKVRVIPLDLEQLDKLMEMARAASSEVFLGCALGGYAGLRIGEVANLRWEDVDLKGEVFWIGPADEDRPNKITEWEAKTDNSYRSVPINPELAAILKERKKQIQAQGRKATGYVIEYGGYAVDRYNFKFRDEYRTMVKAFNEWCRESEKPVFQKFHVLRHSFVSIMLNAGVSLEVVAKIIGDTYQTCYNTYFHLMPKNQQKVSFKPGQPAK